MVFKKFSYFGSICLIQTISCPSEICPFQGCRKPKHLLYSFNVLPETSSILAVFNILYIGEVGRSGTTKKCIRTYFAPCRLPRTGFMCFILQLHYKFVKLQFVVPETAKETATQLHTLEVKNICAFLDICIFMQAIESMRVHKQVRKNVLPCSQSDATSL
jgi:hypothetical protein